MSREAAVPSGELTQCLFGELLLKKYPDRQVILVEAEKTAVIGYACLRNYLVEKYRRGELSEA